MIQASTVKRTTVTSRLSKNRMEAPVEKPTKSKGDLNQKIAEKAYELYLQRNGGPGSAEQDWIEAERIVKGS